MSPAVWRASALLCIALAIAFVGYQLTIPDRDDLGLRYTIRPSAPGLLHVTGVEPRSPAANAGIRAGDTVWYGDTALQRARVRYATAGTHVHILANGRSVTLVARRMPPVQISPIITLVRVAFLLVAALLAWRRPDDAATRALVAFLGCYGLAIAMGNGVLPSPLLSLIVLQICNLLFFLVGTGTAAVFAARFPTGTAQPLPRMLARLTMLIAVALVIVIAVSEWLAGSAGSVSLLNAAFLAASVLIGLLVVATLIIAYVQGAPAERQRRKWVFFILGLGLLGPLADIAVTGVFGLSSLIDELSLLPLALVPFGLAYVILRHRVIDVGFVLNRAVVYTGVSVIVVGVFVIVETLLAKYVESTSHVTSIAVQMAVALALGFSIRYVHARVDRFVDNVLFRERHLAEATIRDFAHDASYITETDVLLARCVKVVERYAKARGAGVWVRHDGVYRAAANTFAVAPDVGENDPAVVSMRARRVNVHVRDCDSSLPGFLGFPMIVRGELLGILVCGPKIDDETYAPDERDALASLAASVGHALDAIEVRDLRRRLEALTATGGGQPAF